MTPDEAVAEVTATSINRQGAATGSSAIAVSSVAQMPSRRFSKLYEDLTEKALIDAQNVDKFIQKDLQDEIVGYCRQNHLHPLQIINFLGSMGGWHATNKMPVFKDSMDPKRLLLIVEGQKTLLNITGMMGITALRNLLDQFTALKEGIEKEKANVLFSDAQAEPGKVRNPVINYNQVIDLPGSLSGVIPNDKINMAEITVKDLHALLQKKYKNSPRSIRDVLIRMACLQDKDAAVILANSGGLGNTYSLEQLNEQIQSFLPLAINQLTTLARKQNHTPREHYTMYLCLNELFSSIPEPIRLQTQLANMVEMDKWGYRNQAAVDQIKTDFTHHLYVMSLQDNIKLVETIKSSIEGRIASLQTIDKLPTADQESLRQYGITEKTSAIEAANQLAGIASLDVTGTANGYNAKVLLTHTPVFTPEGFACYFEHLAGLVGQPKVNFAEQNGIYALKRQKQLVTKKEVMDRLSQVLSAIMIADEVHKKEFRFLYDKSDPFYQRINRITQQFLGKQFIDVLPHRIGMSGTMNHTAEKAFSKNVLYTLSIQKMIGQGLVKHLSSATQVLSGGDFAKPEAAARKQEYAKQLVVDYFTQNNNLSIKNILGNGNCVTDLFNV